MGRYVLLPSRYDYDVPNHESEDGSYPNPWTTRITFWIVWDTAKSTVIAEYRSLALAKAAQRLLDDAVD